MNDSVFPHDIFLSHSANDKAVVRPLAEPLREDGLKVCPVPPQRLRARGFDEWVLNPGDSIPAKIEEGLEHCRVLVLCMLGNASGSDWAPLACPAIASSRRRKAGTFRFRDLLNQKRRFFPRRLHDAHSTTHKLQYQK